MIDPETGFPTGYDPKALGTPFEDSIDSQPKLSVEERTRRWLATHPYMWEHMAFNLWRHEDNGPFSGIDAIHAWNRLTDAERDAWIERAKQEQEDHLQHMTTGKPVLRIL